MPDFMEDLMQVSQNVQLLTHPVAQAALTILRDVTSSRTEFVRANNLAALILALEVTSQVRASPTKVVTPLGTADGRILLDDRVILVPILRAGMALLDPFRLLLPRAQIYHIGIRRDESTALPERYYPKDLPQIVGGKTIILLDPMLATGGSVCDAIDQLKGAGAEHFFFANVIASQEGLNKVCEYTPQIKIVTLAIDAELNDQKYIVPGLGDYGDRFNGTGAAA